MDRLTDRGTEQWTDEGNDELTDGQTNGQQSTQLKGWKSLKWGESQFGLSSKTIKTIKSIIVFGLLGFIYPNIDVHLSETHSSGPISWKNVFSKG